jgi:hypothetical protein
MYEKEERGELKKRPVKAMENNLPCLAVGPAYEIRLLPSPRFREIVRGRLRSLGDFLFEDVRTGKVVGFFEAFVSEPEAGKSPLVAVDHFVRKGSRPLFSLPYLRSIQ